MNYSLKMGEFYGIINYISLKLFKIKSGNFCGGKFQSNELRETRQKQ